MNESSRDTNNGSQLSVERFVLFNQRKSTIRDIRKLQLLINVIDIYVMSAKVKTRRSEEDVGRKRGKKRARESFSTMDRRNNNKQTLECAITMHLL